MSRYSYNQRVKLPFRIATTLVFSRFKVYRTLSHVYKSWRVPPRAIELSWDITVAVFSAAMPEYNWLHTSCSRLLAFEWIGTPSSSSVQLQIALEFRKTASVVAVLYASLALLLLDSLILLDRVCGSIVGSGDWLPSFCNSSFGPMILHDIQKQESFIYPLY